MKQHTLTSGFELSGVGLHTGIKTHVRVLPADSGEGRYFVRVDIKGKPFIPARVTHVIGTTLSTELGLPDLGLGSTSERKAASEANEQSKNSKSSVRTVEHLLSALAGSGVDNARIEIDGPELPLLDGSAKDWVEAIASTGVAIQEESPSKEATHISTPIWIYKGDAFVAALPSPVTRFTYGIDFDNPSIGNQWHSWSPQKESFATEIAPARTFGFAHQIEQLREAGLIKGGSLDNALVCTDQGWLNPPLRFSNEPARHKLLDLVGDLSLLGNIPVAHFLAYKASHNLHVQLAQQLAQTL